MLDLILSMLETTATIVLLISFLAAIIFSGVMIGEHYNLGDDRNGSQMVGVLFAIFLCFPICIGEAIRAEENRTMKDWTFLQSGVYLMMRTFVEGVGSLALLCAMFRWVGRLRAGLREGPTGKVCGMPNLSLKIAEPLGITRKIGSQDLRGSRL